MQNINISHLDIMYHLPLFQQLTIINANTNVGGMTQLKVREIKSANQTATAQLTQYSCQDRSHMGLDERQMGFVAFKQQKCRPACASAQSDQRLCHLLSRKYRVKYATCKRTTCIKRLFWPL